MQQGNGGIIGPANNPTNSVASGVWGLNEQAKAQGAGNWPIAVGGYEIERSLRFNSADTPQVTRVFATAGNRQRWTWSGWVKRSALSGSARQVIFSSHNADNDTSWFEFGFESSASGGGAISDVIFLTVSSVSALSTAVFRDLSAWYHIVVSYNGSNVIVYVNNSVVLTWARTGDLAINGAWTHSIGETARATTDRYFNGYITEVNFIDGQALTPSEFGEIRSTTGVWSPKQYTGTYGTNGFYLPFNDNSSVLNLGRNRIPFEKDPDWQQTVLLLNGDGANGAQNNTFLDGSTNNFTITRNGNTTQGTFSPFSVGAGEWSNYFPSSVQATNQKLSGALSTSFGSGNFTVEFFVYWISTGVNDGIFCDGGNNGFLIGQNSSGQIRFGSRDGSGNTTWATTLSSATAVPRNSWAHVAIVRSGTGSNQTALYIDGISVATGTLSANLSSTSINIGGRFADGDGFYPIQCYLSNFRISNTNRTITVPTTPYISDANTLLLTCQANRFIDSSSNAIAITRNGSTSVTPFSPFAPTAAYSAGTNGGSGYFPSASISANQKLTATLSSGLGTGNYTIDFWFYPLALPSGFNSVIYDGGTNNNVIVFAESTGQLSMTRRDGTGAATTIISASSSTAVRLNSWNHVAVVRSGTGTNEVTMYINGVSAATGTSNHDLTGTGFNLNGRYVADGSNFYTSQGYFANFRISNTARTITVPTAPPTSDANTYILCNFTNAGIIDNTGKNVLETVGNAQVDTSVKKFGTGSMKFDGTGDRLLLPNNPNLVLGSGDFTIECWLNRSAASSSFASILQMSSGADSYSLLFGYTSGANLLIYISSNGSSWDIASAQTLGTVQNGTWVHYALTRSGSTFRAFQDGVQQSTWTSSASIYQATNQVSVAFSQNTHQLAGFIDDLRITKVAKYTGNFSVPDAPFALTTVDNNYRQWVPTNFSVTPGAGNDSLVDSPIPYGTDTGVGGEVRGNYATLNPLVQSYGSGIGAAPLSNGNLVATSNASSQACFSTIPITSGKWYFEATLSNLAGSSNVTFIGLVPIPNYVQSLLRAYAHDGTYFNGTSWSAYGASYTTNDIISCAVDLDSDTVEFFKNGVSQGQKTSIGLSGNGTYYLYGYLWVSGSIWTFNFGQRPFAYTAPSGFKALCTTNLPEPTVVQGDDHFNTVLYTGNAVQDRTITGVGFSPDFTWIKNRSNASSHVLMNVLSGGDKQLFSNLTNAEQTNNDITNGFAADGFILGDNITGTGSTNQNGNTYVAWNWKANGAGVSNTAGSITSTVSANTTAGVSIVTYSTPASGSYTVGHGLGVAPAMFVVKTRSGGAGDWVVYHRAIGAGNNLLLNSTAAQNAGGAGFWNSLAPTSTVLNIGSSITGSYTIVAYCFAAVPGFSAFGSYTGNGSADGPFVYLGFRPRYVLIKQTNTTNNWVVVDTARNTFNLVRSTLYPDLSNVEENPASGVTGIDFVSNGFKIRDAKSFWNTSSGTYIYAAFAENPFKYSLAR